MTLSAEVLETIMGVLQKELAEVTIDPKQEYHLNWEHFEPKEYQKMLFRAREEVRAVLESEDDVDDDDDDDGGDYKKIDCYRLVFYIISEPCSEGGEKELSLYESPYFASKRECIEHASNQLGDLYNVTWELLIYAENSPLTCHKPAYLAQAETTYADAVTSIQTWLRTGLDDPLNLLAPADQSDYCCHFKVSEPKYNINAYVRFEEEKVWLQRKDS